VSDKFRLDLNLSYLWNDNKYIDNSQATLTRSTRVPDLLRLYNDDGKPQFGENLTVRNRLARAVLPGSQGEYRSDDHPGGG
jgi:hypothetical protein